MKSRHFAGLGSLLVLVAGTTGCGTNWDLLLLETGEAFARSALDLFLTDLANDLLVDDDDLDDDNGNSNGNDNANGNDNGNGGPVEPGDPERGETVVADRCAACHGADGASGFAANIQGATEEEIAAAVAGEGGHIPVSLSEQEIADAAAFLQSF